MSSEELEQGVRGIIEWSEEELQEKRALTFKKRKRSLSKQLSMCEALGDMAWERRRRQTQQRRNSVHDCNDEDLRELRGCIELGFGFNEEDGQKLCNTLPALDLYFAVNRNLSSSPVSTPTNTRPSPSIGSPTSPAESDSWKICSPGIYIYTRRY